MLSRILLVILSAAVLVQCRPDSDMGSDRVGGVGGMIARPGEENANVQIKESTGAVTKCATAFTSSGAAMGGSHVNTGMKGIEIGKTFMQAATSG